MTGNVVTDMNDTWHIAAIERLDPVGAELPFEDLAASAFLSVQLGQEIEIAGGRAIDPNTRAPLYRDWSAAALNERYFNVADGRFWAFDFHNTTSTSCFTTVTIRAAFGTVDADTLEGVVEVFYATSCPQPLFLRPDPNGSYRVTLVRGAAPPPARLDPEAAADPRDH